MGALYWGVAILVIPPSCKPIRVGHRRLTAAGAFAVMAVCQAGSAHALDGDRIRPFIGVVGTYYSNLFYTDDRIPTNRFFKGVQSDFSYGLRGGVNADYYLSRQRFTVAATATQSQFQNNGGLDNIAYNARGAMNWVIGSNWDGDLGATFAESLGSFADIQTKQKNPRTTQSVFGSAMYRVFYDWKLRAALTQSTTENGAPAFRAGNIERTVMELGSRYYSKGGDSFLGLNFKDTVVRFPNRVFIPGVSKVDSGFHQYDLQGTVDWRYSGETRLSGSLGWTNFQRDELSQRNFTGLTGRLNLNYVWSGKSSLTASVFRDLGPIENTVSTYVLTQGFTVGPSYSITGKVIVGANYTFSQRKFLGDPGFVVNGHANRVDDMQTLSLTMGYAPARNVAVNAALTQSMRHSNAAFSNYSATTLTVSGQLTF